ncbi:hypothetical protein AB0912_01205 [Streptomyces sp. NPDC007084]|uniref:hypothetical protein n=1 Tax=Streptomyces sp. NPDC007084 TaxID=3154313 RepID=UPI0034561390
MSPPPLHDDAAPIKRGLIWKESNSTERVREFVQVAVDATGRRETEGSRLGA